MSRMSQNSRDDPHFLTEFHKVGLTAFLFSYLSSRNLGEIFMVVNVMLWGIFLLIMPVMEVDQKAF